jgi:hypothetical protein
LYPFDYCLISFQEVKTWFQKISKMGTRIMLHWFWTCRETCNVFGQPGYTVSAGAKLYFWICLDIGRIGVGIKFWWVDGCRVGVVGAVGRGLIAW